VSYHYDQGDELNKIQISWSDRAVNAFAPMIPAAIGITVAIRFNNSDEQWVAALVGWIVGWLFTLIAIARWETSDGRPVFGRPEPDQPEWRRGEIIAVISILLAALLLRVVAIEDYPIALHNDEMSCLIDARIFLESNRAIFDVGWFSCPNLGFFLTSLPLRVLGPTLFALRLSSAFLGLVSLIAAYLFVRRFFGVRPALLSLLLTTPFHWHLHFSRSGFHYMQAGSLTVVAVLLFALAVDRRSAVLFGCCGVVTGIAFQTYYAAWLIPLILGAWAAARLLSDREEGKIAVKGFAVTIVLVIVTLAPILTYYLERPDAMISRSRAVLLFSDHNREHLGLTRGTSNPVTLLAGNATRVGWFLTGKIGDGSGQYGLNGRFFDPFLLPLLLAGLAWALTLVRKPGGQLLWIWFLGTIVAGGLMTIDAPFSPRLIGITAVILLFPALLIDRVLRVGWIADRRWLTTAVTAAFGAVFVCSTWWNLHTTFVRYPKVSGFSDRDYIIRLATGLGNVRTIVNFSKPEDFDHEAYQALLPKTGGRNFPPGEITIENPVAVVKALRPFVLVIVPLASNEFYGLCDQVGGDPAGWIMTGEGATGFEWCFVK
jgi:4-amino-4-deoxy-L-arabinose transferase-like glycosyltransferase